MANQIIYGQPAGRGGGAGTAAGAAGLAGAGDGAGGAGAALRLARPSGRCCRGRSLSVRRPRGMLRGRTLLIVASTRFRTRATSARSAAPPSSPARPGWSSPSAAPPRSPPAPARPRPAPSSTSRSPTSATSPTGWPRQGGRLLDLGRRCRAEAAPWDVDLKARPCSVLGGEGKGLRPRVAAACDGLVALPRRGEIESLNVSAAATALLFEAVRQRAYADRPSTNATAVALMSPQGLTELRAHVN